MKKDNKVSGNKRNEIIPGTGNKHNEIIPDAPEDINEILMSLPEDKRVKMMEFVGYMEEYKSFNGPLPAPEDFQQYEQVLPGAADRILSMAEKQLSHRTDLEKEIVAKNFRQSSTGQYIGASLALLCIAVAFWLGMNGHDWLAGIIASTTVIGIITVFVLNQRANGEKNDKTDEKNDKTSK